VKRWRFGYAYAEGIIPGCNGLRFLLLAGGFNGRRFLLLLLLLLRLLLLLLRLLLMLLLLLFGTFEPVARQQHSTEDHLISAGTWSKWHSVLILIRNACFFYQPPPPTNNNT